MLFDICFPLLSALQFCTQINVIIWWYLLQQSTSIYLWASGSLSNLIIRMIILKVVMFSYSCWVFSQVQCNNHAYFELSIALIYHEKQRTDLG